MAGHYRNNQKGHGLTPDDFKGMKSEEILFQIDVEGKKFSGYLVPSGIKLPFGVPSAFVVHIKGEPPTNISIHDGEWVMQAPESFVNALGSWIESYYE